MFSTLASWLRTALSRKCIYVIFIIRSKLQGGFPDHGSRCGNRMPRWNRCYGGVVGKNRAHFRTSNRIHIPLSNSSGHCRYNFQPYPHHCIKHYRLLYIYKYQPYPDLCIKQYRLLYINLNINRIRIRISIFNSSGLCRYNFQPYPHRCIKHYRPLYI